MLRLLIGFTIILNSCFAQDTLNLSQTHFKINSCEIDSSGFVFLDTLKIDAVYENYILTFKEYTSMIVSAHYAACRSQTLTSYLETKYKVKITEVKFVTIMTKKNVNKKAKTKIPISQEIYLIPLRN